MKDLPQEGYMFPIVQDGIWAGMVQKLSSLQGYDASTIQYICIQKYIVIYVCTCLRKIEIFMGVKEKFRNFRR